MIDGTDAIAGSRHEPLPETVRQAILSSGYEMSLGQVEVDVRDGLIVLSGRVSTFYHKQVAQTVVMKAVEHIPLRNEVEVRSPR